MKKAWVLRYPLSAQRRLWSDWADAQADLSLHWPHTHFVGFVMSWLTCTHRSSDVCPLTKNKLADSFEWAAQTQSKRAAAWQNQQYGLCPQRMVCAPSEDSDQPGHPPSLIRVFVVRSVGSDPSFLHVDSEDSDQPGHLSSLVSLEECAQWVA